MGYTKIVQFGNVTEIYEYEKNINRHRRTRVSSLTKKRNKKIRDDKKNKKQYQRSPQSIKRSRDSFFRLCHHNVCHAETVHFLTLTFAYDIPYKTASRHVARFMERVSKAPQEISIRYISVPELTKKGRYHFHLLLFDLSSEIAKRERKTRNLQRQFQRGYVDIMRASYSSKGIAGYMSKYMGKALVDFKNEVSRGYNCSRNIIRPYYAGGNTLSQHLAMIVPEGHVQEGSYDVPYLGKCHYKKITK